LFPFINSTKQNYNRNFLTKNQIDVDGRFMDIECLFIDEMAPANGKFPDAFQHK